MDILKWINIVIMILIRQKFKNLLRQRDNCTVNKVKNGQALLKNIIRYLQLEEITELQPFPKFMMITNIIQKWHGKMEDSIQ
jgi:hypothetical protein